MSHSPSHDAQASDAFQKLKEICVPLLGCSRLTRANERQLLALLDALVTRLKSLSEPQSLLNQALIQYVFFPISSILQRNDLQTVPDQVLERISSVLEVLSKTWWWTCDVQTWEQLVMLSGSNLFQAGPKFRKRDDHTKEAAARCILQLMRPRSQAEASVMRKTPPSHPPEEIFGRFKSHAQSPKFFPILGQLVHNVLDSVTSSHRPLQLVSLQLLNILVSEYFGANYAPIILPGVVSSMCKVILGKQAGVSGWQNSEICEAALLVMKNEILHSLGDDVCVAQGLVRGMASGIEELSNIVGPNDSITTSSYLGDDMSSSRETPGPDPKSPGFVRSTSWLTAMASQLHIALNTLAPLLRHPNAQVLLALANFSNMILGKTRLTLVPSHALLLSYSLTLSVSSYSEVSLLARNGLIDQLANDKDSSIVRLILDMTQTNMNSLPRLIPTHSDAKVQYLASQVEAVCMIASSGSSSAKALRSSIQTLLGPTGHVEKWGFSLLYVLDFSIPSIMPMTTATSQFLGDSSNDTLEPSPIPFPSLELTQLRSTNSSSELEAFKSLEQMLRELARAGGETALYTLEWFVERGTGTRKLQEANAALWVAGRLLEGIGGVTLGGNEKGLEQNVLQKQGKKFSKACRWIVRAVTENLDTFHDTASTAPTDNHEIEEHQGSNTIIEYKKGMNELQTLLDSDKKRSGPSASGPSKSIMLQVHSALLLHLLAITSSVLTQKFRPLLLESLYPALHSLVSPHPFVASTAQSTLRVITSATAYTSPAHILVANFDYALNSCSLHLTRARLDIDATKVLALLVRLVGSEVVEHAGDVVEECFDRLDEYHGYNAIVAGLVDVLGEVVRAVRTERVDDKHPDSTAKRNQAIEAFDRGEQRLEGFFRWFAHRHDPDPLAPDEDDFGPVPQTMWGDVEDERKKGAKGLSEDEAEEEHIPPTAAEDDSPLTPLQALTQQIISRSLYFLTHPSSMIRARILSLLASSVPILRTTESSVLPSIHKAWPFVINRLSDTEPFVVTEAAGLVESLVLNVGDFMYRRVLDDVWPRFQRMLLQLEVADSTNALTRRRGGNIGTRTPYSSSHRTYRSLLSALRAVVEGTELGDALAWDMTKLCRRFLSVHAHPEIQSIARELYIGLAQHNPDMVWLVLCATIEKNPRSVDVDSGKDTETVYANRDKIPSTLAFLKAESLDILGNVCVVLDTIR
ncbi:armadillo-type protein [Cantharellus anzutake]|uniref:armadillo-type protein n=1 Tax=Cantharellus anzutake TaxID=1750568 RepID=UPI0019070C15|nr:armadillo-type protein [Cantharellus anzutake]KAF8329816.1 armadillo-type protein [Cantharellus anzutake]